MSSQQLSSAGDPGLRACGPLHPACFQGVGAGNLRTSALGTFPRGGGPAPKAHSAPRQLRPQLVGVPSEKRGVLPWGGPACKGVEGQQGQSVGVVGQELARQVDDPLVLLVGLGARRGVATGLVLSCHSHGLGT